MQEVWIGIATIAGLLILIATAMHQLGKLAANHEAARTVFLQLMSPASVVSLLILLGVLFLLGTAILDLDKGRVLLGMGKAPFARGLITYLFSVVTIGTAVVLVLSALLGADKERFDSAKEILGLLLGVFGTIVGFYFASELSASESKQKLTVSPVLLNTTEVAPGGSFVVTVSIQGGAAPYRYAVAIGDTLPDTYPELVRPDGWIVKSLPLPANIAGGVHPIRVGVLDANGDKSGAQSLFAVVGTAAAAGAASSPASSPATTALVPRKPAAAGAASAARR